VAAVHGYNVAFAVSAALFGVGALVAVLLLPSRRRLEELRNAALAASDAPADSAALTDGAAPTDSAALTDRLSADHGVPAADPR
jgi:hypothetical protein